jgi:hypothetical protein
MRESSSGINTATRGKEIGTSHEIRHRVEEVIRFLGDGRISSDDSGFHAELNEVLNLNLAFLVKNRKETLAAFMSALPRTGPLQRTKLETWLREWTGESGGAELRPYCQVIVFWLRKRLAR